MVEKDDGKKRSIPKSLSHNDLRYIRSLRYKREFRIPISRNLHPHALLGLPFSSPSPEQI